MSHRLFKYVCRPWLAWDGPQVSGADGTPFRKDAFNTSTSVPRSTSKGVLRSRTSLVCLQSGHTEACQHLCECFSQWLEGMLSCRSFMVSLQGGADAAVPDAERAGHHTVCHRGPAHGLLLVAAGRPRHPRCLPGHPRCAHACAHPCLRYRALHVHTCILAITLFSRLTGSQRGTVMVVDSDCIHAAVRHVMPCWTPWLQLQFALMHKISGWSAVLFAGPSLSKPFVNCSLWMSACWLSVMLTKWRAAAGLLFFELMFLTFRSMFTALFTFPEVRHPSFIVHAVHSCPVYPACLDIRTKIA